MLEFDLEASICLGSGFSLIIRWWSLSKIGEGTFFFSLSVAFINVSISTEFNYSMGEFDLVVFAFIDFPLDVVASTEIEISQECWFVENLCLENFCTHLHALQPFVSHIFTNSYHLREICTNQYFRPLILNKIFSRRRSGGDFCYFIRNSVSPKENSLKNTKFFFGKTRFRQSRVRTNQALGRLLKYTIIFLL